MTAFLEVWPPNGPVREVLLDSARVTVGRAEGNDVVVADPKVSRRHLVFERLAAGWCAHDVDSLNGTLVNGEPLVRGHPLYADDQLHLGETKIVYRAPPPA